MQLFTRRAAQMLYGNQRLQRWCFDVELLYLASQLHIPVAEVAVAWTEIPGSPVFCWYHSLSALTARLTMNAATCCELGMNAGTEMQT